MKILGSDYDGTFAHGGIGEEKREAVRRFRAAGRLVGSIPLWLRNIKNDKTRQRRKKEK